MRSGVTIAMVLLGIWTILTGITIEETPRAIGSPAHHIFAASAFVVVLCIHVWLNKKAFLQRFKGLGWKWSLIGVGILIILATTVWHPR
jgi:Na+/melibiose symporter-like transporter